jgi:hypothetical protein
MIPSAPKAGKTAAIRRGLDRKMSRFWSRLTHELKPYVPGE